MKNLPSHLIKFYTLNNYSYSSIINAEIYFSHRSELNDPFEGTFSISDDWLSTDTPHELLDSLFNMIEICKSDMRGVERLKKQLGNNPTAEDIRPILEKLLFALIEINRKTEPDTGFFSCVASSARKTSAICNILMWSHYCGTFKGVAVKFKTNELISSLRAKNDEIFTFSSVQYSKKPIEIILTDTVHPLFGDNNADTYKNISWRYEREYRLMSRNSGLFKISPSCVDAVYIGHKLSSSEQNSIAKIFATLYGIKKIYRTFLHPGNYSISAEPFVSS